MKIFNVLFCLITISFLLVQCQNNNKEEKKMYDIVENDTKSTEDQVDRLQAIQKCASCHQEEYKNWLIGPHANAYKSLLKHVNEVDSSGNYSENYKKQVSSKLSTVCISCHTGQNLFETVSKGLDTETNEGHFTKEFYSSFDLSTMPVKRTGKFASLNTGIDCLTCHKSGDKVVTNASFKRKDSSANKDNCDLVPSKFFSTNSSCLPCHKATVVSMQELVSTKKIKNEINCNSCHMEHNEQGKATHYFYWKNDAPEKKRPESLSFFADLNASIKLVNGKQELFFHWGNNYIPHYFTDCGDVIASVEVRDKKGNLILEFHEVANNKKLLTEMYSDEHFKEGDLGNPLNMYGKPLEKTIPVYGNLKGGKIIITGKHKSQYWSHEKEPKEVFKKEFPINL